MDKKNKNLNGTLQSCFDNNNKRMFIDIVNALYNDKVIMESDKDNYMKIVSNWDRLQLHEVVIYGGSYGYKFVKVGTTIRQVLVR